MADGVVDQRQLSFVLANGGLALAVEGGIEERELPGGRGFFGEEAVAAAFDMQVLGFIACLVNGGEAGADVEVDVGEERVLGNVKTDGDSGGIAVADFEIDVADGGVEGVGVGVGDVIARYLIVVDLAGRGRERP